MNITFELKLNTMGTRFKKLKDYFKSDEFIVQFIAGIIGLGILILLKYAGSSPEEVLNKEVLGIPTWMLMMSH